MRKKVITINKAFAFIAILMFTLVLLIGCNQSSEKKDSTTTTTVISVPSSKEVVSFASKEVVTKEVKKV